MFVTERPHAVSLGGQPLALPLAGQPGTLIGVGLHGNLVDIVRPRASFGVEQSQILPDVDYSPVRVPLWVVVP